MSKCEDGIDCKVSHIWTIDPASGAERRLTSDAGSWDDDPAVSPDGSRVAFQRCPTAGGMCRIAVVDIGGGNVTYPTAGAYSEDYPAFSPDGRKLVFSRDDPSGGVHLVVMDAAGGDEHPLTSGTAADRQASWSPDGSTIAFERGESGVYRIYETPASGGSPTPLTAGSNDRAPSFSPDGSQIVFSASDAIAIMGASGAGRHALTAPGADFGDEQPAFAPDGTQIVCERYSQLTHSSPLLVMNSDGSNQHLVSGASETVFKADWQPTHPATTASTADHSAPVVTLAAPRRESVRNARLHLFATSDEPATGVARGKVTIPALGRRYRLRPTAKALSAHARTKVRLRIPRTSLHAIRAALGRHEKVAARIVVAVEDGAGNVTAETQTIRLMK